ncbi:hypothetical protein J3E69DRAFT_339325 [Trichoderma sp. SZMC 28015]
MHLSPTPATKQPNQPRSSTHHVSKAHDANLWVPHPRPPFPPLSHPKKRQRLKKKATSKSNAAIRLFSSPVARNRPTLVTPCLVANPASLSPSAAALVSFLFWDYSPQTLACCLFLLPCLNTGK